MANEKIVVILLLITIILSVASVILAVSVNLPALERRAGGVVGAQQSEDTNVGYVSLDLRPSGG